MNRPGVPKIASRFYRTLSGRLGSIPKKNRIVILVSGTAVLCLGGLAGYFWLHPAPVSTPENTPAGILASRTNKQHPKPAAKPKLSNPRHNAQPAPALPSPASPGTLAAYAPAFANGLITNEYAYWNTGDPSAKTSSAWQMTSGSLFAKNGAFWTGNPDACPNDTAGPNPQSTNCTDSAVFRLNTAKTFSGNIKVSLKLKQDKDIHNSECNTGDTCWYGTHIWLRYQNEFNLYYASINRADGNVVIKRKVPCGDDNSGTYFVLGSYVKHNFTTGVWNNYSATAQTNSDGSVTIKLYDNTYSTTTPVDTGTDRGGSNPNWSAKCTTPGHYQSPAYKPITTAGAVGVRGDYANFEFTGFRITAL